MNRHDRRRARALKQGEAWAAGGDPPPGYVQTAEATHAVLSVWLDLYPNRERPRFRFPPREMALAASIKDIGHRLAVNETAHELVDLWCELKARELLGDHPTALMVRACLDMAGIGVETCSLTDLGLVPMGGGGGYQ